MTERGIALSGEIAEVVETQLFSPSHGKQAKKLSR